MKLKSLLSIATLGMAIIGSNAYAGYIKIADTPYDGIEDQRGGEFIATLSQDPSYATKGDNVSFLTFCLEKKIKIKTGDRGYTYDISNMAKEQNDVLSQGSAWLYTMFVRGTLQGINGGSYFDVNRDENAGALQLAFWILENEGVSDPGNFYVALAQAHFSGAATADVGADSRVKVINVWGGANGTDDVQDLLIFVPDSGMTAALLGLGLLSLAAFRRKAKVA